MTVNGKSSTKIRTSEKTKVDTKAEVAKGAVGTMGVAGAIVALWSIASLVGGMIVSGGPVALVKAWIGAVTGQ